MEQLVILSKLEQEYLLRIIESSLQMRDLRQFFLWTQGQLQALLPHEVMVCMQFDQSQALQRLECIHGSVQDTAAMDALCALAVQMAQHASRTGNFPLLDDGKASGYDNVVLHGSGRLAGGSTAFALFGLPMKPGARHAYFLDLLLPHLHMALLRLAQPAQPRGVAGAAARPLTARESEIIHWLREGKSNYEIARILGLSALTVKNHLQRIYRMLGVSNRTQAVSRCLALRLLGDDIRAA